MINYSAICNDFLCQYGMHPDFFDIEEQTAVFLNEMEKGLCGRNSSLLMLPTYISVDKPVPREDSVIVIDAGGTNLRIALVSPNQDRALQIFQYEKYPMPGTNGTISFEQMCDQIAMYLFPLLVHTSNIAICFSFPAVILPSCDATVLGFNKEVSINQAEDMRLGENIKEALQRRGVTRNLRITVLNDSVAALLGAVAMHPSGYIPSNMGFILGTGMNLCYFEPNPGIKKISGLDDSGYMAINTEAGGYNLLPRGVMDRQLDAESAIPGDMISEKMMSGAYFGELVLRTAKQAATNGLFTDSFARKILDCTNLSMQDINQFCNNCAANSTNSLLSNKNDSELLYGIIDKLWLRAAKITVMMITAAAMRLEGYIDGTVPFRIAVEGTTFYKSAMYHQKVMRLIHTHTEKVLGRKFEFMTVENATILGSALAGLITLHNIS